MLSDKIVSFDFKTVNISCTPKSLEKPLKDAIEGSIETQNIQELNSEIMVIKSDDGSQISLVKMVE